MRVDNSPDARLGEQIAAALYLNHPYGRPVIGWQHEIETLDARGRARLLSTASTRPTTQSWWSPATSRPTRSKALAEKTYGKVPRVAESAARRGRRSRRRPRRAP